MDFILYLQVSIKVLNYGMAKLENISQHSEAMLRLFIRLHGQLIHEWL